MNAYAPHLIFTNQFTGEQKLYAHDTYGNRASVDHDAGVADAKGRKIGVRVTIHSRTYTAPAEGEKTHCLIAMEQGYGTFWYVDAHKTKNGQPFGASQAYKRFNTLAEAEAYSREIAAERIAEYRKNPK